MNHEFANLLLTNLAERAVSSDAPVILTSKEIRALRVVFLETEDQPAAEAEDQPAGKAEDQPAGEAEDRPAGKAEDQPAGEAEDQSAGGPEDDDARPQGEQSSEILPDLTLGWKPEQAPIAGMTLCLDFGTSLSKAYGCEYDPSEIPELVDIDRLVGIEFGEDEDGERRYMLPSELFIHKERIYFGSAARDKFVDVEAKQERLIDSPKQYITLGTEVAKLHEIPLKNKQDPSEPRKLSQRDALVLYLAHLNHMVDASLKRGGKDGNARRRYAHPAWGDEDVTAANAKEMARIMAESIVLAKRRPDDFRESVSMATAREYVDAVRNAADGNLPQCLVGEPVLEATAAGAGALMATRAGNREWYVILDIGAGTTDVTGCLCTNPMNERRSRVFEVPEARETIPRAGNEIDAILLKKIFESCVYDRNETEGDRIYQAVRKKIRNYKETLFSEKYLEVPLDASPTFKIRVDEFLSISEVMDLFGEIEKMVIGASFAVADAALELTRAYPSSMHLVATGGGADLPVIDHLCSKIFAANDGRTIRLTQRDAMPSDLRDDYPDLIKWYPQLAVAIGGSHPVLPEQRRSIKK